jgi:hypothetical protein
MKTARTINIHNLIWAMFFVIVFYNALDVYQSYLLFSLGSSLGLKEWNPIFLFLEKYFGLMKSIIAFKCFFLVLLAIAIIKIKQQSN